MPKPTNKEELLSAAEQEFDRLLGFVHSFPEEVQLQAFPAGTMNRNIRDVLGHLYHWHLMFFRWHEEGMAGKKPDMPAKGHSWKTTPALNKEIWEACQKVPLTEMEDLLKKSHQKMLSIIQQYSEEELFQKKRYKWTGSTSMGAYLISSTSSHYNWGYKLIKKSLK
ncbi:MAG: ClbS/DfsB family four-helix bundle protein [Bacteroidota bacterium]